MGVSLIVGVSGRTRWDREADGTPGNTGTLVSLGPASSHTHAVPTSVWEPQPTVLSLPGWPRTVDTKYST